jgi:hypothetical protein
MTGTEPHASALRGTAGRGPNWDRGPRAGHAGAARRCTKRHRRLWAQPGPWAVHGPRELRVDVCSAMHISAPPAARPFGDRGPRAGRRSCATRTRSGPTRLRMRITAPPAAGPAKGPWAASGREKLRDSERSHGCRRDAVTVCFQYLVPQVTVSDDSTIYSELALLHSKLGVAIRILPFELWPRVLEQTARKLVSLVTTQIVCESC